MEIQAAGFGKSFSPAGFFKKAFKEGLDGNDHGDAGGCIHKLLVIAVHAVLLESGFVGFDMNSKAKIEGFQFRNNWEFNAFRLPLYYTLPVIIHEIPDCHNFVGLVKFLKLGKFLCIYGCLNNVDGSATHSLRLDGEKLAPFLHVAWGLGDRISPKWENLISKIWKKLKDKIAFPLLIGLCERAGLQRPPCFMRLPQAIKLKILNSLPGDDIAKLCCVSSELWSLASGDELWEDKFLEFFRDISSRDEIQMYDSLDDAVETLGRTGNWKERFRILWARRVRRERSRKRRRRQAELVHRSASNHPNGHYVDQRFLQAHVGEPGQEFRHPYYQAASYDPQQIQMPQIVHPYNYLVAGYHQLQVQMPQNVHYPYYPVAGYPRDHVPQGVRPYNQAVYDPRVNIEYGFDHFPGHAHPQMYI